MTSPPPQPSTSDPLPIHESCSPSSAMLASPSRTTAITPSPPSLASPQPTPSPTASTSNALPPSSGSFNTGALKSGMLHVCFNASKSKKLLFGVLSERTLELHESEKSWRKKKNAKYLVDLANCFNISKQTHPKMKLCMCVMSPDETVFVKSAESDQQTVEWHERAMTAVIPARALRLGRPVFENEFFECAWDVLPTAVPKLKKPTASSEGFPNICLKRPDLANKPHRLCFYAHTVILSRVGIEPCNSALVPASGVPPFKLTDFVEFPRQFVASFGRQEKYFILRIGRTSPMGAYELWAQCESEETAIEVHGKLNEIVERETEKKRKGLMAALAAASTHTPTHSEQSAPPAPPPPSRPSAPSASSSPKKTASPKIMRDDAAREKAPVATPSVALAEKTPKVIESGRRKASTLTPLEKQKRSVLRNYKAIVDCWEEENHLLNKAYYEQQAARHEANSRSKRHQSIEQAIAEDIARCQKSRHFRDIPSSSRHSHGGTSLKGSNSELRSLSSYCSHRNSMISRSSSAAEEETEDSGGTLKPADYAGSISPHSVAAAGRHPHVVHMQTRVECHQPAEDGPCVLQSVGISDGEGMKGEYIELFSLPRLDSGASTTGRSGRQSTSDVAEHDTDSCSSSVAHSSVSDLVNAPATAVVVSSAALRIKSKERGKRGLLALTLDGMSSVETGLESGENLSTTSSSISATSCSNKGPQSGDGGRRLVGQAGDCHCVEKASCSSSAGSASHLVLPECAYASDSGDSCYSSMICGQLNPRAMSFSSDVRSRLDSLNLPVGTVKHRAAHLGVNQAGLAANGSAQSQKTTANLEAPMQTLSLSGADPHNTDVPSPSTAASAQQARLKPMRHALLKPTNPSIEEEDDPRRRTLSLGATYWPSARKPQQLRKLSSNDDDGEETTALLDPAAGPSSSRSGPPSRSSISRRGSSNSKKSTGSRDRGQCQAAPLPLSSSLSSNHSDLVELDFEPRDVLLAVRPPSLVTAVTFSGSATRKSGSVVSRARINSLDQSIRAGKYTAATTACSPSSSSLREIRARKRDPLLLGSTSTVEESRNAGGGEASPSESSLFKGLGASEKRRSTDGSGGMRRRRRKAGSSREELGEVCCFISPSDMEKLAALTSKDSTSMSSQKTADFATAQHFETIEENAPSRSSSKSSTNRQRLGNEAAHPTTSADYLTVESPFLKAST